MQALPRSLPTTIGPVGLAGRRAAGRLERDGERVGAGEHLAAPHDRGRCRRDQAERARRALRSAPPTARARGRLPARPARSAWSPPSGRRALMLATNEPARAAPRRRRSARARRRSAAAPAAAGEQHAPGRSPRRRRTPPGCARTRAAATGRRAACRAGSPPPIRASMRCQTAGDGSTGAIVCGQRHQPLLPGGDRLAQQRMRRQQASKRRRAGPRRVPATYSAASRSASSGRP